MRAVQFDHYGDVDVLQVRDVPQPEPAAGGVVIEVLATSINPGEAMIRSGAGASGDEKFPMGEGSDIAGRVAAVGEGVTEWSVGDEVIGWSDQRSAHAQFVAVPENQLVPKPAGIDWPQAGCLYVAGGTACALRDAVPAGPRGTVVVTAAAGGVGTILTQLLVRDGFRVLAVAGPDNDDWLRGVGAEPVHHGDGLADRIRTAAPDGVIAFLDCFGNGYTDLALELGVPKEAIATIADMQAVQNNGTRLVFSYKEVNATMIAQLAGLVADGDVVIPIAATFPLERVQDAYRQLADRHTRGKIVLIPA